MSKLHKKITNLELADHFDDLIEYADAKASPIEKALIYINIIDVFASFLGYEFESAVQNTKLPKAGKIRKEKLENISKRLKRIADNTEYDSGWHEIANKLDSYRKYRNNFVHNLLMNRNGKVQTIKEMHKIIFMTGELAEEIYNLIIGAREELEFSQEL